MPPSPETLGMPIKLMDAQLADDALIRTLEASRIALKRRNFDFFAERLPRREHYRIALTDPRSTVFLDIETTGLSQG
jgi:hypothetical protein